MNSSAETVITLCCCAGPLGCPLGPVIFPGEGNQAVFQLEQAAIGNGHAMGVAAQIFQHAL